MEHFLSMLADSVPSARILEYEPLSRHTSFHIGGPARALVCPGKPDDIPAILACAYRAGERLLVIGNGTNLLVPDEGVYAVVLKTAVSFTGAWVEGDMLYADAGCLLSRAAVMAQREGLAGLAFAHGIPGSVGGAVVMNAGAYGGELRMVLESVTYCDETGEVHEMRLVPALFGHRRSPFTKRPDLTVLTARMRLSPGEPDAIRAEMDDLIAKRAASQPLDLPSAGSVFKRPDGYFTGKLIQDAGLKGCRIGGAQVSEKHAGFIVNTGGASCDDVRRLIEHIQATVFTLFGVRLECEIRFLGE
ncbi:MAG: UDP-N-acetylmuramate dehydrogenase [Clostridiaceae bacterium]|nr:UDP-N-acetylmuramate dehydrogenase [Clostridiaceae bacterium]